MRLLVCLPLLLLAFGCASTPNTAHSTHAAACSCGTDGECSCGADGGTCTCSHD